MGIGSSLGNMAKGLVGMSDVDKAILEVLDQSSLLKKEPEDKPPAKKEPVNVGDLASAANAAQQAAGAASEIAGSIPGLSDVADLLSMGEGASDIKYLRFPVLYNPEKIRLNGHGSSTKQSLKYNQSGQSEITYSDYPSSLELRIPLVLDKTYSEKISQTMSQSMSLSQLGRDAADAIKGAVTGDRFMGNVRKEVEGLASLFRSTLTRRVTFYWSNMQYTGMLTSMSANYVMFDPSGHPTRATVDLSIILADPKNSNMLSSASGDGPWRKFYEDAFMGKDSINGGNFTNSAMGLLNL